MQLITSKQLDISNKIFQLASKELGLADKARAAQESLQAISRRQPLTVNIQLVRLVIKEQRTILEFIEDLAKEERIVFELFLRAIEAARTNLDLIGVAEVIVTKELAIAFKIGSLGFKELAVANKLRAAVFGTLNPGIDTNKVLSLNVNMHQAGIALQDIRKKV